jgi:hypothetical protein
MTYDPRLGANITQLISSVNSNLENNTGATLLKLTPVIVNSSGEAEQINVSLESALSIAGICKENILDGEIGEVALGGRIENVITSANLGDTMYVDKTGFLDNTKPSDGVGGFVAGDFVIRVGIIVKNENNPLVKDLLVSVMLEGQL